MIIKKIAVGNSTEAFVEDGFTTNVRKAHSFRGGMDSTFIL